MQSRVEWCNGSCQSGPVFIINVVKGTGFKVLVSSVLIPLAPISKKNVAQWIESWSCPFTAVLSVHRVWGFDWCTRVGSDIMCIQVIHNPCLHYVCIPPLLFVPGKQWILGGWCSTLSSPPSWWARALSTPWQQSKFENKAKAIFRCQVFMSSSKQVLTNFSSI